MDQYALVTGGNKGIGKAIALGLARRGYNLLLVARSETELKEIAGHIHGAYQVKVNWLAIDLTLPDATQQVSNWCQSHTSALSVLVNNAGYGVFGNFGEQALDSQMNMLQLNINAVVTLSHQLLPLLKQQKQSYILNIASTAAYQAMPSFALYAASKAFILSFSRALKYELQKSNVSVSCLCPGPADTGFASRSGLDAFAELADKFNMSPDVVANFGLKGMFNKKAEIIPGFLNYISAAGARHLPKTLVEKVTASIFSK